MQQMSRAQRMLLVYILLKLKEPRVIQQIMKPYRGGGPTSISGLATKDHDLLDGLADDDHTQYLLHDGTRAMTGDLLMGANQIGFDDVYLRRRAAGILEIVDVSNALQDLYISELVAAVWNGISASGQIQIRPHWNKGEILFSYYNIGVGWVDLMILGERGVNNPVIRMPNLPVADPEDGTSTIWSNEGVLTLGT